MRVFLTIPTRRMAAIPIEVIELDRSETNLVFYLTKLNIRSRSPGFADPVVYMVFCTIIYHGCVNK